MHRDELTDALLQAAPRIVADGLNFHLEVARQLGLSLTDLRYLQLIGSSPGVTAGELATFTGLTTGAVTRMVDRLEQAGFVRRVRETADRRSVQVVPDEEANKRIAAMYGGVATAWRGLLENYTDEQLEVILDLFQRMSDLSVSQTEALRKGKE